MSEADDWSREPDDAWAETARRSAAPLGAFARAQLLKLAIRNAPWMAQGIQAAQKTLEISLGTPDSVVAKLQRDAINKAKAGVEKGLGDQPWQPPQTPGDTEESDYRKAAREALAAQKAYELAREESMRRTAELAELRARGIIIPTPERTRQRLDEVHGRVRGQEPPQLGK